MEEVEIWKPVSGMENYYEVSNKGRLRSLDRYVETLNGQTRFYRGVVMTFNYPKGKYICVKMSAPGVKVYTRLHRLVAEHFIHNPLNKPEVNHKDGNKSNNNVDNLEWVTQLENKKHASIAGLIRKKENHYKAKLTEELVKQIRGMYATGLYTHQSIANEFGVVRTLITRIINNKRWKCD